MMPTSAEARRGAVERVPGGARGRGRSRDRRAPAAGPQAGFTLLEILATLAVVALFIVPLLGIRDAAWNMAYRSGHMLRAASYAEQLLAERLLDPENVEELQGVFDDDPAYTWEITFENYDVSTGRTEDEEEEETGVFSANTPPDALAESELFDPDDPYKVRRYKVVVRYPSLNGEGLDEYVLEGYAPRAYDREPGQQAPPR